MIPFGEVTAVLLDMDGTLVDSYAAIERGWTRWAEEYQVPMDQLMPLIHGGTAPGTVRAVMPDIDDDAVARAAQHLLEMQYADTGVQPGEGAADLLHALDLLGLPWAVVTSSDRRLAAGRLEAAGINAPLVIAYEDAPRAKPHPDPYLTAAEKLGVDPARCLVVEDSDTGITAGHAAGATVAALRGLDADHPIAGLGELATQLLAAGTSSAPTPTTT